MNPSTTELLPALDAGVDAGVTNSSAVGATAPAAGAGLSVAAEQHAPHLTSLHAAGTSPNLQCPFGGGCVVAGALEPFCGTPLVHTVENASKPSTPSLIDLLQKDTCRRCQGDACTLRLLKRRRLGKVQRKLLLAAAAGQRFLYQVARPGEAGRVVAANAMHMLERAGLVIVMYRRCDKRYKWLQVYELTVAGRAVVVSYGPQLESGRAIRWDAARMQAQLEQPSTADLVRTLRGSLQAAIRSARNMDVLRQLAAQRRGELLPKSQPDTEQVALDAILAAADAYLAQPAALVQNQQPAIAA